jgi:hypothetical protein
MAFTSISQAEIAAGQPVTQALMQKVKDNDDYLYSQLGAGGGGEGGIQNGSFEIDADADGVPDGWTKNLYPAGGGAIETASPAHGANAYKFVQQAGPGNGGGYLDMNDYLPCAPLIPLAFSWLHYATAAGMHNLVQVRWFDKAKVYLSTSDVYNSTSNPTSWGRITRPATPLSSARFWKLRIVGGYTDTDIAGTAYFDGMEVSTPLSISICEGGSIAEIDDNVCDGNFHDRGSMTLYFPTMTANSVVRVTVMAYLKGGANPDLYASQRFRVGSFYSGQNDVILTNYGIYSYQFFVPGLSGNQTLYQQLASVSGSWKAWGKVDPHFVVWEILSS